MDVKTLVTENSVLKGENGMLKDKIDSLEGDNGTLKCEVGTLKVDNDVLRSALASAEELIAQLRG